MDVPELEHCLFYNWLINDFIDLYLKAQNICSLVLVPSSNVTKYDYNREFVESHLFRSSPLFKGKHISLNLKYEISVEDNRTIHIYKPTTDKLIKILDQENVFDSSTQRSYIILIIDRPLNSTSTLTSPITSKSKYTFHLTTASYETAFIFLDALRPIEDLFTKLRTSLLLFIETYVILPNFIDDAVNKLNHLWINFVNEACQILNIDSSATFRKSPYVQLTTRQDIELASEIFITGNVYTKNWPAVITYTEMKDDRLSQEILKYQCKTAIRSSTAEATTGDNYTPVLAELKKLDYLKSSFEKAACIRSTLDLLLATMIQQQQQQQQSTENGVTVKYTKNQPQQPIAADDTLTSFIDLLTQSDMKNIVAHEYYTITFKFLPLPQDVDYAVTTFRASIEYLSEKKFLLNY